MTDKPVGVVGLGLLGRGIATCLLAHGHRVIAYSRSESTRTDAREHIAESLTEMAERAALQSPELSNWQDRYCDADSLDALADCRFVIESIVEDLDVKQHVFDELEQVVGPDVPIASNTSAMPISILQQWRVRPERFVGMHWGEPAHILRFLEIIRGEQTADAAFDATVELAYSLGKEPSLVQKDVRGFITNRLMYAMLREAFHLLETGVADVETIDRSFRNDWGWWSTIAGPFRFMDLTGIAAYAAVMRDLLPELSNQTTVPVTIQNLVDAGADGVNNGRGFYEYTEAESRHWQQTWTQFTWDIRELAEKHVPTKRAERMR